MGQNPAVEAPHSRLQTKTFSNLKCLFVRAMFEIESGELWGANLLRSPPPPPSGAN